MADPFVDCKAKLLAFGGSPSEFLETIVSRETFASWHNEREIVKTVGERLDAIAKDDRTHRELATDPDFSIGALYPVPIAMVVKTIAVAEGWSPECLAACLLSNMAFLEHQRTRLAVQSSAIHAVSPNIPIVIGASSSARKSSLLKFTTDLLVTEDCPCDGIASRSVFLVDATLRGIRNALVSFSRCSVSSDEIVNTYHTPWSETSTGVNYLSRSKLNTYLNCERDDVITATSTTHIQDYAFQHKVAGQVAAAEWVLKPAPHGYHKRISLYISPDRPRVRIGQDRTASVTFLKQLHEWMQAGPMSSPEVAALDGIARSMNDSVAAAVENFLADPPSPVQEALRTKLGFVDTDLLRLAHVNLRFLERLLDLRWPDGRHRPATLQLYAFALAIRGWLRQVHIHSAYYKYIVRMMQSAAATSRGGGGGTAPH